MLLNGSHARYYFKNQGDNTLIEFIGHNLIQFDFAL